MNTGEFNTLQCAGERFKKINIIKLNSQNINLSKCGKDELIDLKYRLNREISFLSKIKDNKSKIKDNKSKIKTLGVYLFAVDFNLSKIKKERTKKHEENKIKNNSIGSFYQFYYENAKHILSLELHEQIHSTAHQCRQNKLEQY